jgi:hypothetical protein
MRRKPLLSRFRDEDGRSLARALIVLVIAALFAGGLNAGDAAAEGRTVLCAATVTDDGGVPADAHLFADCCLAGVMPLGTALAAPPPVIAAPEPVRPVHVGDGRHSAAEAAFSGSATARGPPRSA